MYVYLDDSAEYFEHLGKIILPLIPYLLGNLIAKALNGTNYAEKQDM